MDFGISGSLDPGSLAYHIEMDYYVLLKQKNRRVIAYPNERLLGSWVSFRIYGQNNYTPQSGLHCAHIYSYS